MEHVWLTSQQYEFRFLKPEQFKAAQEALIEQYLFILDAMKEPFGIASATPIELLGTSYIDHRPFHERDPKHFPEFLGDMLFKTGPAMGFQDSLLMKIAKERWDLSYKSIEGESIQMQDMLWDDLYEEIEKAHRQDLVEDLFTILEASGLSLGQFYSNMTDFINPPYREVW